MTNIGNKEILAKNLCYYIERSGKSQKELSELVGVSPSTFNDWVKAKKYPRIDKIEMLANYFGILKSDLIEDKTKQPTDDGELSEDLMKISALISELDDSRLGAALEIAQKISTLSEAEVAALLAVVRSMGGK